MKVDAVCPGKFGVTPNGVFGGLGGLFEDIINRAGDCVLDNWV